MKLGKQDIIYLFSNDLYHYLKDSKSKIIGSDHANVMRRDTIYSKILFSLIKSGIFFRRLDGFHFFPYQEDLVSVFKKKFNLIQGIGTDTDRFSLPKTPNTGKIKYLYVSRLVECKGSMKLIEAWNQLENKDNVELHIVGDGPLYEQLKNYGSENVFIHGTVSEHNLSDMYMNADIFIYPSMCDAYPQVIIEAMSAGLYVVASNYLSGNFNEFERKGFMEYSQIEPKILSNVIIKLASQINEIRGKRASISQYIADKYDLKIITGRLYDFLNSIQ